MRINIEFNLRENGEDFQYRFENAMDQIKEKLIPEYFETGIIRDINGNKIGEWKVL
ncbi:hypothetical protein [Caulobacter phage Cr30]|uniref:hypothetical protein n=1 Tax=Caulobacter phage Cr30 TaxID=1357714 RepID=UPI0004A9B72D|nr:hypothetical protein OZ74_gp238 [Caulobacter phage Cr30]AGS81105.1 hypothetical protein [Caulobacter phage Cr30]